MIFKKKGETNIKFRVGLIFFSLVLLQGCSMSLGKVHLSSGIQYIGQNAKVLSKFKKLNLNYKKTSKIDINDVNKKFILIEPNEVKTISKEEIESALKQGFYVFFINVSNDKEIQKKYFNSNSYEAAVADKPWVEQIYTHKGDLKHVDLLAEGNFTDNLSRWLTTLSKLKSKNS